MSCVFILYLEIGNRVATEAHVLYTRHKTKRKKKRGTDPAVYLLLQFNKFRVTWLSEEDPAGRESVDMKLTGVAAIVYVCPGAQLYTNTHDTTTSTCLVGCCCCCCPLGTRVKKFLQMKRRQDTDVCVKFVIARANKVFKRPIRTCRLFGANCERDYC